MVRSRSNVASYMTKDGSRIWELFHPGSSPVRDFSVAEALVEPGHETLTHKHHASQEVYYVLEGEGVMLLGKETLSISSGDAILIPPGWMHNIQNKGAQELRILCICCPPYSHDDTALEG